jgi:hypothetical protein
MTAPPANRDRNATGDDGSTGQPRSTGEPRSTGQPRSAAQPRSTGQSRAGGEPPGADLLAGVQRWLIRSGARSMRRELTGQVRKTFSGSNSAKTDVWDTATTETPPEAHEAPECTWCPICQAARRIRESGPGLTGQLAGVGDAVATAVQDALSAFDSVLSTQPRSGRPSRPAGTSTTGKAAEEPDDETDDRG